MGGYLELYGLWDWFRSQSVEVQEYLYKSSGCGINTDPSSLTSGKYQIFHMSKELSESVVTEKFSEYYDKYWPDTPDSVIAIRYGERTPTATTFLCQHAMNALHDKNHVVCQTLMDGAFRHVKSMEDSIYHGVISQKIMDDLKIYPNQNDIDKYKTEILALIRDTPGILQMDVKKHFPTDAESFVGHALSQLKYDGKIRREKKGRSFQLWAAD